MEINEALARKILGLVDQGLVHGVGTPEPGKMCIEAVVVYALGLPHGDDPPCVSRALRSLKIKLNDALWSSDAARAKGLRRLAVAQLGSRDALDDKEFARRCATLAIRTCVPNALRAAASMQKPQSVHKQKLLDAADLCERDATVANARGARVASASASAYASAYAAASPSAAAVAAAYAAAAASAYAYAYASASAAAVAAASASAAAAASAYAYAYAAKRDEQLAAFAEGVVQILIDMKAPGCEWLTLTEDAA